MPALGTHAIQSGECLREIKPELESRGIEVNGAFADFVGAAAVSHDSLALLFGTAYDRCFVTAHEKYTDAFFLAMIAYIKENDLRKNANAMAFLYGQIMHYALDISAHPLIYYMTERHPAKFTSALGAHALFETWVDTEREAQEKAKAEAQGKSYKPNLPFRKNVGKGGIDALIDTVYGKVYGLQKAARGYRIGIKIWHAYQLVLRGAMMRHVKKYFSDFEEMLNPNGGAFPHPVTGETLHAAFQQSYDASIALARELIAAVNANIFDNADNEALLKKAFGNSYDTGIAWDDPRTRQHFKSYD